MHEAIQTYCEFNLVLPVRLLDMNNLKRDLARDVSRFKLRLRSHLRWRSFTRKEWLACSHDTHMCLAPGQLIMLYQGWCSCKNLHPSPLTLFCLHITTAGI